MSNDEITKRPINLPDWLWEEVDVAYARVNEYDTKSAFYQDVIETGLINKQDIDLSREEIEALRDGRDIND